MSISSVPASGVYASSKGPDHAKPQRRRTDKMQTPRHAPVADPKPAPVRLEPKPPLRASMLSKSDFWLGASAMANIMLLGALMYHLVLKYLDQLRSAHPSISETAMRFALHRPHPRASTRCRSTMHTPSMSCPSADTHPRVYVHPHIHVLDTAQLPKRPAPKSDTQRHSPRLHTADPCELGTSLCSRSPHPRGTLYKLNCTRLPRQHVPKPAPERPTHASWNTHTCGSQSPQPSGPPTRVGNHACGSQNPPQRGPPMPLNTIDMTH